MESVTRLARSTLFVPGSNPRMIVKAATSAADVVCLDLDDSVALEQKAAARATVIHALQNSDFGQRTRMVRVNAVDTAFAYRDVIEIVEAAGQQLDLIMLPKVNRAADVLFLDMLLTQVEAHMALTHRIGIEVQIETASGFLWLREIAQSSSRLEALIFGPGDYAASMGMPLNDIGVSDPFDALYPGHRWHAAMHGIVAAARANGLRCIDGPFAAYRDVEGLERACGIALALGFDGKQCIHPDQLVHVNRLFSPTLEQLVWANEVVAAYEQAATEGRGALSLHGKMIDAANIRMAQTIVRRQQAIDTGTGANRQIKSERDNAEQ